MSKNSAKTRITQLTEWLAVRETKQKNTPKTGQSISYSRNNYYKEKGLD